MVPEGVGVGRMSGRSSRSALSRKRATSFSEKRGEKPVEAIMVAQHRERFCLA